MPIRTNTPPAAALKADVFHRWGLVGAPVVALGIFWVLPHETLSLAGRATAAVGVWMALWWLTDAVPLAIPSLLPIVMFPILGVTSFAVAAKPYANEVVFMFFGGMLIAAGMERSHLHYRFALHILRFAGTDPARLIGGFMVAVAFASMWISNTAAALIMLPIAASVGQLLRQEAASLGPASDSTHRALANFPAALALGIAYASSIGGVATLIGTPPNLVFAAYVRDHFPITVSFLSWAKIAFPPAVVLLAICWWVLVRVVLPVRLPPLTGAAQAIRADLTRLGPLSRSERTVLIVFVGTATAWLLRPFVCEPLTPGAEPLVPALASLTDAGIAMIGGVLLFLLPGDVGAKVLDWETAERKVAWDVLLLFGGGLSLAHALDSTGVTRAIASSLSGLAGLPVWLIVVVIGLGVKTLTEFTSNTALSVVAIPIVASIAPVVGAPPLLLMVTVTMTASLAFVMPVGTPPNALVLATGQVTPAQMVRAGLWVSAFALAIIVPWLLFAVPLVFAS